MHDSNPFNFHKDTEQDLQEQILFEERLNFANDICETLEMSAEDLIGLLSELVEAVEQLDELSPKTLASYIYKAHQDGIDLTHDALNAFNGSNHAVPADRWKWGNRKVTDDNAPPYHEANIKKFNRSILKRINRRLGVHRAAHSLADDASLGQSKKS